MKTRIEKQCAQCKELFYVHPYRAKTSKFCSRRCKGDSQKGIDIFKGSKREWLNGNKFAVGHTPNKQCFKKGMTPWNKGIEYHVIAGKKNWNWKGGKPNCLDCGKQLVNYQAKRCQKCYHLASRGANHYAWKGGRKQQERGQGEYNRWRKLVYKRDHWTCQACGGNAREINAHHIESWAACEEKRYDINNGIALCKPCHQEIHLFDEILKPIYFLKALTIAIRPT